MKRFASILFTLIALVAPAGAQTEDDSRDVALHQLHQKAAEPQVQAAEAFAAALMNRAEVENLDLAGYVKDSRYLANAEQPVPPEQAAELREAHAPVVEVLEGALGLPGLFGTLHGFSPLAADSGAPQGPPPPPGCQCSKVEIPAPFPGSSRASYPLGPVSVSPAPVTELTSEFRSGGIAAGHHRASSGAAFPAPEWVRSVEVRATMDLFVDVGVGGLGLAHGWSDVELVVWDRATRAEVCRSSRLETANLATGAWYRRETRDLGEKTFSCSFVRTPGAAADYEASIHLRTYGTYAGFAGGHSLLRASFKRIDALLCP